MELVDSSIAELATEECIQPRLSPRESYGSRVNASALAVAELYYMRKDLLDSIFDSCLGVGVGRHDNQQMFDRVAGKDLFCFAHYYKNRTKDDMLLMQVREKINPSMRCYFLESAEYCKECYGFLINGRKQSGTWSIIARFSDATGASTHPFGSCSQITHYGIMSSELGGYYGRRDMVNEIFPVVTVNTDEQQKIIRNARNMLMNNDLPHYFFFGDYAWSNCYNCEGRNKHMLYLLQDRAIKITALFDTETFDLARTQSVAAVLGFKPYSEKGVVLQGLSEARYTVHDGCEILDAAIARGLATQGGL